MKKVILAAACIMALASPAAAQKSQPTDGASSQGNVGPGASEGAMKNGTINRGTTGSNTMKRDESKGMTPPAGPGNTNSSNPQAGGGAGGSGGGR